MTYAARRIQYRYQQKAVVYDVERSGAVIRATDASDWTRFKVERAVSFCIQCNIGGMFNL